MANDDLQGLPQPINDAVATEIKRQGRLQELGFKETKSGAMVAVNCRVTLYSVLGEYEIDIVLPNGSAVGFDVPIKAVSGRTADEIRAERTRDGLNGEW